MKERILMLVLIFSGALLQQLLPAWPLLGGAKPPILAALALHYALRRTGRDLWLAIFAAALLRDGLDLGPFGPALLAFPLMGLLARRVRNDIFADGLVTQLVFGALAGGMAALMAMLVYMGSGQRPVQPGHALLHLLGAALLGMATLPLVSRAASRLEAALPRRRGYGWQ